MIRRSWILKHRMEEDVEAYVKDGVMVFVLDGDHAFSINKEEANELMTFITLAMNDMGAVGGEDDEDFDILTNNDPEEEPEPGYRIEATLDKTGGRGPYKTSIIR